MDRRRRADGDHLATNWMNGTAASAPTITQVHTGVWRVGLTLDIVFENGSWLSQAIPNMTGSST